MIEQRGIEALEGWSTAGVVMLSGGSQVEVEIGNGTGKPTGIAPATRTCTRRTILPENPRVTRQNEPKNIKIGQVLREIY